ncbi:MAG TPA: glycosyltransferase, partial [Methanomicrobia archaeon]|nr:glycosyltransferase [Methanomicrobia archaeon]HEX59591.1 glycosyltransferase [Methanomicrobia archaeon]
MSLRSSGSIVGISSTTSGRRKFSGGSSLVRVGVAITTYNDIEMTTRLLESIIANTEFDEDYALLVFDDGTPNEAVVSALETLCMLHGVDYARHERNKGIPAAWHSCVRTLHE